jgi:hypothetical protein
MQKRDERGLPVECECGKAFYWFDPNASDDEDLCPERCPECRITEAGSDVAK